MNQLLKRRTVLGGIAASLATPLIVGRRASAADRSITVGIYTGQQGDVVRKQIIPPFEAKHKCKVFTTQGVTLEQIALMRTSRNNPKYSVMFIDDIGVELAKREGLIEKLPREQIPNMERVMNRFMFYDGYGAAFAVSAAGIAYNPQTGKPLTSYGDLWDPKFKGRFLMYSPKATQSLFLLMAAVSVETGKPYTETQHMMEQAWPKMEALKPNVLALVENQAMVMQVAEGQADLAGIYYSKSVYPYTVKGAPLDMCYPKEGTFAGINTVTLVKNGPEREIALAFIDWMLSPEMQKLLAEETLTAPSISGLDFKPDVAKYLAYPETKMDEMGIFSADWEYINPIRSKLLEKYNQVFGA
jgi:putative spermidine/putrescine transport system substrate-binding protein